MGQIPAQVLELIQKFDEQSDLYKSPSYNETQLRIDFVNPMFKALGWDIDNTKGYAEAFREVVHEDAVRVAGTIKSPDYSFRVGGRRMFFLEAKKPAVNIHTDVEPAYQLRRYAWTAGLPLSILTNFAEFAVYDCRVPPKYLEKASTARLLYFTYKEYPQRWEEMAAVFSPDAIQRGAFDRWAQSNKKSGTQEFDDAFLDEMEEWRKRLAMNLALRNQGLGEAGLNFATQRIIDRIIFLRICEDRGVEPPFQLQALLSGESTYARLRGLFTKADQRYNSGIFHFRKEQDRHEAPDELTPGLEVDDVALKHIIKRLYYPDSPYVFKEVAADILGSVYERFLGNVIHLTAGHHAKVEPKPEVRKAGGVYYTPTYIVDYIVQNTVGKLLGEKSDSSPSPGTPGEGRGDGLSPKEAANLRILDPACGSGSFLLGAYQYLLNWHQQWYLANDPGKWSKGRNATLRPLAPSPSQGEGRSAQTLAPVLRGEGRVRGPGSGQDASGPTSSSQPRYALTIRERKRILTANIYGVDLDPAAVEVTKLSLLLKCLEGESAESIDDLLLFHERALPDLGDNIKCGNSLISTDIYGTEAWEKLSEEEKGRLRPFNWQDEFPKVMKQGGFDAVIGNPPYVRMEEFVPLKRYLKRHYAVHADRTDLYGYFVERGLNLCRRSGLFSMIVSNKFVKARYGAPLRQSIRRNAAIVSIVDFAGLPVFQGATVRTLVLTLCKGAAQTFKLAYTPPPHMDVFTEIASNALTVDSHARKAACSIDVGAWAGDEWSMEIRQRQDLRRRLQESSVRLADWLDVPICYGVKSGLVEAFVLPREHTSKLVGRCARCAEVVRPYVIGREIGRYAPVERNYDIIYTPHGIDMKGRSSILRHLAPFRSRLAARATRQEWYELQQPQERYVLLMKQPKIIYPDIAKSCRFTLDRAGLICGDTSFAIPSPDLVLLAVLNSRLGLFYFRSVCAALEGASESYLRFKTQYVEDFPIPKEMKRASHDRLVALVEQMLALHKALAAAQSPADKESVQRQIDATDRQIDELVYRLYELTEDEIKIVEEATA